jgi:hypothetical protein
MFRRQKTVAETIDYQKRCKTKAVFTQELRFFAVPFRIFALT